ncbi:hypothetical protein [Desulfovibrio sp. TomC]|uniref:hypothetical protein n=1 Tax=Desulfovibrio sp. TomC TaxID=1562888 RepID=UPI000573FDE1|nr:hypothetical protein [Desulfovibrio sp. TomC]KHK01879.1 hypothetical protein NY78_2698 [Desulfovibrio sp. TomC]
MKFLVLCVLLAGLTLLPACSLGGPSDAEVELAFRSAVQRNDILGILNNVMAIERFVVDKKERKADGVYEATVTIVSSASLGPLSVGGAKQTVLRLKKIDDRWVVLQ